MFKAQLLVLLCEYMLLNRNTHRPLPWQWPSLEEVCEGGRIRTLNATVSFCMRRRWSWRVIAYWALNW